MQHIFLTYMVYKERVNNGINYATAAWWTKERAEAIKELMLARSDVEEVFIQELSMEDAPQEIKEQNGSSSSDSTPCPRFTKNAWWPETCPFGFPSCGVTPCVLRAQRT